MPKTIDLNTSVRSGDDIESFIGMARRLGLSGMTLQMTMRPPIRRLDDGFILVARLNLKESGLSQMKQRVRRMRERTALIAAPLKTTDIANWAAKDPRVDIIMPYGPHYDQRLRKSTARLAAEFGTALEIPIAPLLEYRGLARAKMLKAFREMVRTATAEGMPVVVASGASRPIMLRAPMAMQCAGRVVGLNCEQARLAIADIPLSLIETNEKRLSGDYVYPGIEILQRGEEA